MPEAGKCQGPNCRMAELPNCRIAELENKTKLRGTEETAKRPSKTSPRIYADERGSSSSGSVMRRPRRRTGICLFPSARRKADPSPAARVREDKRKGRFGFLFLCVL